MDCWPDNSPETLEDLCVRFCGSHLKTFCIHDPAHPTYYSLRPGLSLPKTICDKIFNAYVNCVDDAKTIDDGFLHIFTDTQGTQLSRLTLANSSVTDEGLKQIHTQPIVELDLSECHKVTSGCIPFINKMGKTLRSLRLENTPALFEEIEACDSIFLSESKDACEDVEGQDGKSRVLKCPSLRKLCMRGFHIEEDWQQEDRTIVDLLDVVLSSFQCLTHLDLTMCAVSIKPMGYFQRLHNLVSLSLADVDIEDLEATIDSLCRLHQLKHLDLSQSQSDLTPVMYLHPEEHLRTLMTNLTKLISLDLSGTNLAGFEKSELLSFRLGKKQTTGDGQAQESSPPACSIPGLEGRQLDFLGLLGCAYGACYRANLPATQVTGDHDEAQVLLSLQVYQDRPSFLTKALNNLFPLFRISTVNRQCTALEAILSGMKRHPGDRHVQISGSASLFYIAKGDKKDNITQKQRRRIVDLLLRAMESFPNEQTMMRNGCLTLCHFNIPHDVIYCYEKLVNILLRMLKREHQDEFIHRIGIFLLNCLACQVDGREKEMVGSLGAIETMLNIIQRKLLANECDEVMEVAWSTMWNVTDETAPNCERFMDLNGMELFLQCLEKFENRAELLRNMMGLMGNIAEVKELRSRLMVPEYVQVFSDLLDSTSDGIEVSYNAAGVLAHLASDGRGNWGIKRPPRSQVLQKMVKAINRWDICSRRNINYRSFQPILRLLTIFDTPQVQHWAAWALCNLTGFCPDKYCSLLEKENGVQLLEGLLADPRPYRAIHRLSQRVLKQMEVRTSWTEQPEMEVCSSDSGQEYQESEGEEEEEVLGVGGDVLGAGGDDIGADGDVPGAEGGVRRRALLGEQLGNQAEDREEGILDVAGWRVFGAGGYGHGVDEDVLRVVEDVRRRAQENNLLGGQLRNQAEDREERGQGEEGKVRLRLDGDMDNLGFIDSDSDDDIRL